MHAQAQAHARMHAFARTQFRMPDHDDPWVSGWEGAEQRTPCFPQQQLRAAVCQVTVDMAEVAAKGWPLPTHLATHRHILKSRLVGSWVQHACLCAQAADMYAQMQPRRHLPIYHLPSHFPEDPTYAATPPPGAAWAHHEAPGQTRYRPPLPGPEAHAWPMHPPHMPWHACMYGCPGACGCPGSENGNPNYSACDVSGRLAVAYEVRRMVERSGQKRQNARNMQGRDEALSPGRAWCERLVHPTHPILGPRPPQLGALSQSLLAFLLNPPLAFPPADKKPTTLGSKPSKAHFVAARRQPALHCQQRVVLAACGRRAVVGVTKRNSLPSIPTFSHRQTGQSTIVASPRPAPSPHPHHRPQCGPLRGRI